MPSGSLTAHTPSPSIASNTPAPSKKSGLDGTADSSSTTTSNGSPARATSSSSTISSRPSTRCSASTPSTVVDAIAGPSRSRAIWSVSASRVPVIATEPASVDAIRVVRERDVVVLDVEVGRPQRRQPVDRRPTPNATAPGRPHRRWTAPSSTGAGVAGGDGRGERPASERCGSRGRRGTSGDDVGRGRRRARRDRHAQRPDQPRRHDAWAGRCPAGRDDRWVSSSEPHDRPRPERYRPVASHGRRQELVNWHKIGSRASRALHRLTDETTVMPANTRRSSRLRPAGGHGRVRRLLPHALAVSFAAALLATAATPAPAGAVADDDWLGVVNTYRAMSGSRPGRGQRHLVVAGPGPLVLHAAQRHQPRRGPRPGRATRPAATPPATAATSPSAAR